MTVVPVLVTIPPTDGMWRLHLLWPLICAGIACGFDRARRLGRVAVVDAGVLAVLAGCLPARLGADGGVLSTTGPLMVRVNEESRVVLSLDPVEVEILGWLHSIELSTPESGGVLRSLRFARR